MSFAKRLQSLPKFVIYAILFVVTTIPLFKPMKVPISISCSAGVDPPSLATISDVRRPHFDGKNRSVTPEGSS